jgi:hypothetical protein
MLIAGGVRSQKTQARYRDSIEGISPPSSPAWTHPLGGAWQDIAVCRKRVPYL